LKVTSDVTTYTNPGDVITFYYEITNIGDKLINRDLEVIVSGSSLLCKKKCCVAKTTHFYDHICLKPCESVTFVEKYTVVVPDLEKPYIENFVLAAFRFDDCVFLRSCEEVIRITNTDLSVQPADAAVAPETTAAVEVKAE
jgi:hypothetical protein